MEMGNLVWNIGILREKCSNYWILLFICGAGGGDAVLRGLLLQPATTSSARGIIQNASSRQWAFTLMAN